MPRILHIHSKTHDILINMHNGKLKIERSKFTRNMLPKFENIDTPVFDSILRGVFRLSGFDSEIERHFWEICGADLYRTGYSLKSEIVFYGDTFTSEKISKIVRSVTMQDSHIISNIPSSRFYCHETVNGNKPVIPVCQHGFKMFDVGNVIKTERDGIFYNTVCGLSRIVARGKFDTPSVFKIAHDLFFRNAHPVDNFLSNCVLFHSDVKCNFAELYNALYDFCAGGIRTTKGELKRGLESRGVIVTRGPNGRYDGCIGVALKK